MKLALDFDVPLPRWVQVVTLATLASAACGCGGEDLGARVSGGGGAGSGVPGGGTNGPAQITWGECDTSYWPPSNPAPPVDLECADIEVPLDPTVPMGTKLSLRVAIQRSQSHPNGKAVFNLAGGPGSSAVALAGAVPKTMWKLLTEYDLVHVDQRGTGASSFLGCKDGHPVNTAQWQACALEHDIDPSNYFTEVAARDLEAVRVALGYSQIALRGTSYGTRLALETLRMYPESITSVVLDGAAPPDIDVMGETLRNFDLGISLLQVDCAKDASCQELTPDVVSDLNTRRSQLLEAPRPILVNGKAMLETEATFLDFLKEFLSRKRYRFRVPGAAHQAALGSFASWDALMSEAIGSAVMSLPETHSKEGILPGNEGAAAVLKAARFHALGESGPASALFAIILCSEWLPNAKSIDALRSVANQQTWLSPEMLDLAEACPAWGGLTARAKSREAVLSGVPTLVLSGELDLNTPPAWGHHTMGTLPRGTHVVLPHETHSTVWTECGGDLAQQFILRNGNAAQLDKSCVNAIHQPPWL